MKSAQAALFPSLKTQGRVDLSRLPFLNQESPQRLNTFSRLLAGISSITQEWFYPNNIDLAHEELRSSTRKTEKTMARQAPMDSLRPRIPHGQPLVRSNRLDCYTSEGSACSCTGPADC